MTPVQLSVLDCVRNTITTMGFAPTLAEISDATGVSVPGVHCILTELVSRGQVKRVPGQSRGLSLPDVPDLTAIGTDRLRGELARRGLTLDALAKPEPLAFKGRACAAMRCGIEVERGHLMCRKHWYRLPHAMRDGIVAAYYNRDPDQYRELVAEAIDLADNFGGVSFDRNAA